MDNTCNHTSNNKFFTCPALMADARGFTDYRPSSYVNDVIRVQNGIYNSYDYRQFLIHYADDLMRSEKMYLQETMGTNLPPPPIPPLQTECVYDTHSGLCFPATNNGLGVSNSAVKNMPQTLYQPFTEQ